MDDQEMRHGRPWPLDERFIVYSDGTVLGVRGRPLKQKRHMHGYLLFAVFVAGKVKWFYVHRAVCETFHGPSIGDANQVDHINSDRADNRAENLRWVTKAVNLAHRKFAIGMSRSDTKLTDEQVREIRTAHGTNVSIAAAYGVSETHVSSIKRGRVRFHVQ